MEAAHWPREPSAVVTVHDGHGCCVAVDGPSEIVLGQTMQDLLGRSPYTWLRTDDVPMFATAHDQTLKGTQGCRVRCRLKSRQDVIRWVEIEIHRTADEELVLVARLVAMERAASILAPDGTPLTWNT